MNNAQLQQAINSAREFLKVTGVQGGPLWEARSETKNSLKQLEEIQVIRAGLMIKSSGQKKGE
jgi:hypothetical protein